MPASAIQLPPGVRLLSVSELSSQVRQLLEDAFPTVWVAAEISNLKYHANGHIYFSLKDANAQIGAVIWKSTAYRLRFKLTDGMSVIAHGKISVYPPQGKYQLAIDEIQPKGIGALELAFQQLRAKLEQRGWFDPGRKRRLPRFPKCIGIVTSPSGAAIRDMLRIISRRWPLVEIRVCPALVQGAGAAIDVARAIRCVNQLNDVDVLIVGRGGGSLEDLWAFNEEPVAEAIFQSRIPVISAVGHEVDVTIADFVADVRAATPSEAAEIVVPDQVEIQNTLDGCRRELTQSMEQRIALGRRHLDAFLQRRVLRDPLQRLRDREQLLGGFEDRMNRATRRFMGGRTDQLRSASSRLEGLSPLNVLGRGYSLTRKADDGELLRSADAVQPGERIVTRLNRGRITSRVESTQVEDSPS